ncbi:putative uncharacterized protein DDB_G0292330, partial [Aplysia californica]|uniref:Neurogenic mastermind-like N-terminal domain-containing protein n=1 Tax=Aplysia californica TaxID=6500 RepID=A0ABM1W440_APLCA
MGDFFAPKRKDVVDKIRRRIDVYRHHHSSSAGRYHGARPGIYEQQKQDTLQLRQRWLDSRAKKAAKQSKTSRDNNNIQNDHRNLVVTKLKKKIDSVSTDASTSSATTATTTAGAETVFNFEEQDQAGFNNLNNHSGSGGANNKNANSGAANNNNNSNLNGGGGGGGS